MKDELKSFEVSGTKFVLRRGSEDYYHLLVGAEVVCIFQRVSVKEDGEDKTEFVKVKLEGIKAYGVAGSAVVQRCKKYLEKITQEGDGV